MRPLVACYREFAPCEALRGYVHSFFSFVPNPASRMDVRRRILLETVFAEGDSFSSPLFADGNVSLVFTFDRTCGVDGRWRAGAAMGAAVIGAMSVVGEPRAADRADMLGVYFRAGQAGTFLRAPGSVLTDRIVALEDLWAASGPSLTLELAEADELARIDILERALLRQLGREPRRTTTVDVVGLTRWVAAENGRLTVERMSDAAGVSRQALARTFRDAVGVTPKVYCMLARFQAGLAYAGCGSGVDWARAAADLGYADQSHLIAEFRRFSSLTPQSLALGRWFHPFIERARDTLHGRNVDATCLQRR
jgi:AraC-like DNA-binding protein